MPAQQAFVHHGSWDDETRSNEAMKWMEFYTNEVFDKKTWETGRAATEDHTDDMVLQKPDGTIVKGAEAAWKAAAELYAPFAAHHHHPDFIVWWETSDGWGMIGTANLYFKLHGLPGNTITDPQGGKWDGYATGGFHFLYVKEANGIKLKQTKIYSDSSPALKLMLKNNLINAEQLAGIVIGS